MILKVQKFISSNLLNLRQFQKDTNKNKPIASNLSKSASTKVNVYVWDTQFKMPTMSWAILDTLFYALSKEVKTRNLDSF